MTVVLSMMVWGGLSTPSSLAAQSSARVEARLRISEVLMLDVEPGVVEVVSTADGYQAADGAVVLRVSANRSWRVTASGGVGATRIASAVVAGDPQPRLWWRVGSTGGGAQAEVEGYEEAGSGERVVASGGPGRNLRVELDYRWLGAESAPAGLVYTISSN